MSNAAEKTRKMTVQVFTVFNKVDVMEGWGTWQESFWEISGNYAQVQ